MKTIAQIAAELGVSTQAIYKKVNKALKNELNSHIKTINGQKFIDNEGVEILKSSLQPVVNLKETVANLIDNNENTNETVANQLPTVDNHEDLEFYKSQIELLQAELKVEREHSRRQAEKIAELADKLAELTHNSQVLQLKSQDNNALLRADEQPLPPSASEKKNLWSKLFKRKN